MSGSHLVWYAAYGSNLQLRRFRCYLRGGRPDGGLRTYAGCRDGSDPLAWQAVTVTGEVVFSGESTVWTGGIASYDPSTAGEVAARAYLLTADQLCDVVAQESRRPVGEVGDVLAASRDTPLVLGDGRYDAVVQVGLLGGLPMLTVTSARPPEEHAAPSAGYLATIATGLAESHGWRGAALVDYLAARPGVAAGWSPDAIADLLRSRDLG